jgi:hypothetical protein
MGSCCNTENGTNQNKNTLDMSGKSFKVDVNHMASIIKAQALFRGLLARKKVKKIYGF